MATQLKQNNKVKNIPPLISAQCIVKEVAAIKQGHVQSAEWTMRKMKITKKQLRRIIKEERAKLQEQSGMSRMTREHIGNMRHDFEKAISFGATHVRVGSAIFGDRVKSPGQ